jgi:type IV pilus assembly protein PilE
VKSQPLSERGAAAGFTLIELMIALVVIGLLAAIGYPGYTRHVTSSSRAAAKTEVGELSSMQEKIFLNANAYTGNMTTAYDGTAAGGLGKTSGTTDDGKYTLAVTLAVGGNACAAGQCYTITATPVAGTSQAGDGAFSIASTGARTCPTSSSWCKTGIW